MITFATEKVEPNQNVVLINSGQYPYETNPPAYQQPTERVKQVNYSKKDDYLCCSIFNMLCCVFFLGIPALIFSLKAREQYRNGRFELAEENASIAKKLNIAGIVIGSLVIAATIILIILQVFVLAAIFAGIGSGFSQSMLELEAMNKTNTI